MPAMSEQPVLVVRRLTHTEPLACRCTLCGQLFMFPEGRSVKEGVAELWAAFDEHVPTSPRRREPLERSFPWSRAQSLKARSTV